VSNSLVRIALIGTAAGFFSGLFGVGGGTVMVPLLIVWFGYGEREATGTSLMAIVLIAAAGTTIQSFYGNVHPLKALIVGAPAIAGVPGPCCQAAATFAPKGTRLKVLMFVTSHGS